MKIYKDKYEVYEDGTIISTYTGKKLTTFISNNGYVRVCINRKLELLHRIIGICLYQTHLI